MQGFKKYLVESRASDQYEAAVAAYINSMQGINAERPKVSAKYADVLLQAEGGGTAWLEVKMNHKDNLGNPRIFYDGTNWDTTYISGAAKKSVDLCNKSGQTKAFIEAIAKFSGIAKPKIPTNKGGLKDSRAVPLKVMKEYFDQPGINRYIASESDVDLGKIVTDHYLNGKAEPAYYMQAGDDFYMIGTKNPLNLPKDIPVLQGNGPFKVRIATRSQFYEVQAEIKIDSMPSSKYSCKPGTKKKNPFEKIK
jgi:hypothetical protein